MSQRQQLPLIVVVYSCSILLLLSFFFAVAVADEDVIDYHCFPRNDYSPTNQCKTIQDGICDDPNHGGSGGDACLNQDCIDCNTQCQQFEADCYGCLNAKGCYYCAGDGTCQNSNEYSTSNKDPACTKPLEYFGSVIGDTTDACIPDDAYYKDPLWAGSAWMYDAINVVDVWETYGFTGKGIVIRINDDGVDTQNKEFDGRFDGQENSCDQYLPRPEDLDGHGTAVAGIMIGNANNDHCAVGIAHEAKFSACNFFAEGVPYSALAYKVETFDISQNSIGMPACDENGLAAQFQRTYEEGCPFQFKESRYRPCDVCAADFASTDPNAGLSQGCVNAISRHCKDYYKKDDDACTDFPEIIVGGGCDYDKLPKSAVQALELGVKVGRNGKGVIYTFASGNKFSEGDDVNFSGWTNSRYTITVGAVGKDGSHADYSTGGSALVVSAPGGGPRDVGHLMTAGLGVDTCADSGQGTSFACPVVSAVIALMLEANSELSWRDVQGILAKTSRQVDDDEDVDDDSKVVVNGAGFWHSRWYGFGVVDAKAAVDAALEWDLFSEELQAIGLSEEENVVLQCDEEEEYVSTIQLDPEQDRYPTDFVSESTVVLLDLSHYNRGDLELILVSPSGTESLLHAGKRPENSQLEGTERWKLMTVRNWGEDPTGKWKLKVRDLIDREDVIDENVFRSWKLIVYGRSASGESGFGGGGGEGEGPDLPDGGGEGEGPDLPGGGGGGDVGENNPNNDRQTSEFCLNPEETVSGCVLSDDGSNSICQAASTITFGTDVLTLDANLVCPSDVLTGQQIDYIEASQKGLCTCDAGLYDEKCDVIKEDLGCECFVCPEGSPLAFSYSCKKKIAGNCKTFDCSGTCNGKYEPPLLEKTITTAPSNSPTTQKPTEEPTESPTKAPKTDSPTKGSGIVTEQEKDPEDVVDDKEQPINKSPSGQPAGQPVGQTIGPPVGEPVMAPVGGAPVEMPVGEVPGGEVGQPPIGQVGDAEPPVMEPVQEPTGQTTETPVVVAAPFIENSSCETSSSIRSTDIKGSISSSPVASVDESCLSGLETVGGWYEVMGNGNIYTLTACSLEASKNVGIDIFTGECSDSACVENQSRQVADCENGYATSWVTKPNTKYNVLVSGLPVGVGGSSSTRRRLESSEEGYDFELKFSDEVMPVNSECQLSFPVPFESSVEGTTVGDGSLMVYNTCDETEKTGAWYTVADGTPNKDGVLVYEANTCNSETNFYNAMSVFRGDCGSLECVSVEVLPCQNGESGQRVYWTTGTKETFRIFVHAAETVEASTFDAGYFSMDVTYSNRVENDQCSAPTIIVLDQDIIVGSTEGAKPDIDAISGSSCETGDAGAWYQITGTGATFQASTCFNETKHQTSIHVFSGKCGSLTCMDSEGGNRALCSDPNIAAKSATVNFKTQEDVIYYILVTGRRGKTGKFGLQVTKIDESPANECSEAVPLSLDSSSVIGSTLQATVNFRPKEVCGVPLNTPGVWHTVEGSGKGVELSTCESNDFNTAISIFKGSCGNLECVTGTFAEDPTCDNFGVTAAFLAESGTKYFIYVHGKPSQVNMGNFELTYTEFDISESNEFCSQSLLVATDGTRIQGSTEDSNHAAVHASSCGVSITNPGLWYTFKGTGQPFRISACMEDIADFDVSVSVFMGGCDDLTCITGATFIENYCSNAESKRRSLQQELPSPPSSSSDFRFMTENREDYYLFVHGQAGVGDFDLFINEDNVSGFGTAAPSTTPNKYGKDLYRWITVNSNTTIVTDYISLTIVTPPLGTAKADGNLIQYSSPLDYVGEDVISVDGCMQGDCYRFNVTVNLMGDEKDLARAEGGDDEEGWNKLWLLILLLIPLILCIPLCIFCYRRNKQQDQEYEGSDNESDDEDDGDGDEFEDDLVDDEEGGQLLPYKNSGASDSSDDDDNVDDWDTSDGDNDNEDEDSDESSDEEDETPTRRRGNDEDDDSEKSDDSDDDDYGSNSDDSEEDSDDDESIDDDDGFNDEYKRSR